ncbi:hypothetical protein JXA32_07250 [Candidatus Sumerlaeota bacterium]|nr:hypothetical protein [Candidatus Sumerlaeota bacterium]
MKPIAYIGMYRNIRGEWEQQRSTLALDEVECRRRFIAYHGVDEDDLTPEEVFDRREAAGEVMIAPLVRGYEVIVHPDGCDCANDNRYDEDEANFDALDDFYHSIGSRPLPVGSAG